jgi:hypothetical protein
MRVVEFAHENAKSVDKDTKEGTGTEDNSFVI